jgi:preprotein translocase subunit YajC
MGGCAATRVTVASRHLFPSVEGLSAVDPSILLLLVSVGLLVLLVTSRRRQQRAQQSIQSQLLPGSEVMTGSGLFATVVSIEDSVVVLETAPGQQSRWDRRAVARVLSTPDDGTADDGTDDDALASDDDGEPTDGAAAPGDVTATGDITATGDDAGRSKES